MFGLELWFVLAVTSAIGGGTFIFCTKVAAERDYDVVLLGSVATGISVPILVVITLLLGDGTWFGPIAFLAAVVNAIGFVTVNILRHRAMQCIDTAIYYPIYKTLTPALMIVIGLVLFAESFTAAEWLGLLLSLLVPLLLISRVEKTRQKDLWRGLRLLVVAGCITVVTVAAMRYGLDLSTNTWLFVTFANLASVASGFAIMTVQKKSKPLKKRFAESANWGFYTLGIIMGLMQIFGFGSFVFAIDQGPLSIVYMINSLYILIPIILSIIFYNEHWNLRKIAAIVISIAALWLFQ